MGKSDPDTQLQIPITLPIEWVVPDTIQSRYATNIVVQSGQAEVVISFFETQLPILVGTPEQNAAKLQEQVAVKAVCVGRIVVAPDQLPGIISALQIGLDGFRTFKAGQTKEE